MQSRGITPGVMACLALVCASWGSCYLFIEIGLRSFPPFLLTSLRIGLAGLILFALLRLAGHKEIPTALDVRRAAFTALFMSVCSGGLMTVGQMHVPSGTTAILMGSVPLWMVLSGWLFLHEKRPSRLQAFGLLLGTAATGALGIRQGALGAGSAFGMFCLALNVIGWVAGSLMTKRHVHHTRLTVLQSTALMLMMGGAELLAASLMLGEHLDPASVPPEGWLSLFILIFFGGITAYACYFHLLATTGTAVAVSYEYANPAVGLLLGHLVTGEPVDAFKIAVCALIPCALACVIMGEAKK